MNMTPLEGSWEKQTAMEAAFNRVENACLAGKEPKRTDLDTARLCHSCWGFGYYHEDEDSDDKTTCKSCAGDGLAANHPNKGK